VLVARRGSHHPKLPTVVHHHRAPDYRHQGNPRDEGTLLGSLLADTDSVGLSDIPLIADVDVVTASSQELFGFIADADVPGPGGVAAQGKFFKNPDRKRTLLRTAFRSDEHPSAAACAARKYSS